MWKAVRFRDVGGRGVVDRRTGAIAATSVRVRFSLPSPECKMVSEFVPFNDWSKDRQDEISPTQQAGA